MSSASYGRRKLKRLLPIALSFTLLFSLLSQLFAGAAYAKESRAAIVLNVEGTVMVTKAGGSNAYRAFKDMSLSQGDHLRTESGSSIVLQVVDRQDELTIGESTEMYISSLVQDDEGNNKSKFKMWAGSLWFKVKKLVNADDEFEVETPTAVMGVRGSNGYITTRYGEIFALMASGILETTMTSESGQTAGAPANIYPGQQILLNPEQRNSDITQFVTPVSIRDFVSSAEPKLVEQLVATIQQIREENAQFIQDIGSGAKPVDSKTGLKLDSPDVLARFGENLTNLVANIAKQAIDTKKLPASQVQSLIDKANANTAGEKIDLNNVKPFDTSIGLDPAVQRAKEEQIRKLQEDRERREQEALRRQAEKRNQNEEILKRLEAERKKLDEANRAAKEELERRATEQYLAQLNAAERARFEADQARAAQELARQQQNSQQPQRPTVPQQPIEPEQPADTTPPSAPIVTIPGQKTVWGSADAKIIKVSAEQGYTIRVVSNKGDVKTAIAGASAVDVDLGNFVDGVHTLTVTATDAAGNISAPAQNVPPITIDRAPPSLTIVHPVQSSEAVKVSQASQTIEVKAESGATVTVSREGQTSSIDSTTGAGDTKVLLQVSLSNGLNTFKITATDAAGNTASGTVKYNLDVSKPVKPVVTNSLPIVVNQSTPSEAKVLILKAEKDMQVVLYKRAATGEALEPVGSGIGKGISSGDASVIIPIPVANDGTYTFYAEAYDADHVASGLTEPIPVIVDTISPVGELKLNNGQEETTSREVTLHFVNASTDIAEMKVSEKADFSDTSSWIAYSSANPVTFMLSAAEGEKTVYVKFRDFAKNESAVQIKDTIRYVAMPSVTLSASGPVSPDGVVQLGPLNEEFELAVNMSGFTGNKGFYAVELELEASDASYFGHVELVQDSEHIFNPDNSASVYTGNTIAAGKRTMKYVATRFNETQNIAVDGAGKQLLQIRLLVHPGSYDATAGGTISVKRIVVVNRAAEIVADTAIAGSVQISEPIRFTVQGTIVGGY